MKKANNFEIAKVQPQGVLFCFCFVILFNAGHNTKVAHIYLHI